MQKIQTKSQKNSLIQAFNLILILTLASCATAAPTTEPTTDSPHHSDEILTLPTLNPAQLDGQPLKIVATTSLIGDVVAQVGGDHIDLTVLITAGQDPHSYEPAAQDLTVVTTAHAIFSNGWGLEEALIHDLEEISENGPILPISAGITPRSWSHSAEEEGEEDDHDDHGHEESNIDPHVWFNIAHVKQWVDNAEQVLSQLDPAHAEIYTTNAAAYRQELQELATYATAQLEQIPPENRTLITNHDSFSYFAASYQFTIVGTILSGSSAVAEPSAQDLAQLINTIEQAGICTIFTETTHSDALAQTVAAELNQCPQVEIYPLHSGALGTAGSQTDSYIKMYRTNIDTIVTGLSDTP